MAQTDDDGRHHEIFSSLTSSLNPTLSSAPSSQFRDATASTLFLAMALDLKGVLPVNQHSQTLYPQASLALQTPRHKTKHLNSGSLLPSLWVMGQRVPKQFGHFGLRDDCKEPLLWQQVFPCFSCLVPTHY